MATRQKRSKLAPSQAKKKSKAKRDYEASCRAMGLALAKIFNVERDNVVRQTKKGPVETFKAMCAATKKLKEVSAAIFNALMAPHEIKKLLNSRGITTVAQLETYLPQLYAINGISSEIEQAMRDALKLKT
jgi:hypothetical protein